MTRATFFVISEEEVEVTEEDSTVFTETVECTCFDERFERFFVEITVFDTVEEVGERSEVAIFLALIDDGRRYALAEVFDGDKTKADARFFAIFNHRKLTETF